ncbi:MAG: zinc metallopeptidase [Planctomyces sp.]|nr:zinc metallopeptidase [Planctomyces sp.]
MRWQGGRRSENVEDRRHMTPRAAAGGGLGLLIIALIVWALGGNPLAVLQMGGPQGGGGPPPGGQVGRPVDDPRENELSEFVAVVLADTEDVWSDLFASQGKRYQDPKLVLFRERVESACGFASSATGPFYCPADSKVYLDLSFFDELHQRFGAPGDFAQAYVLAHEVGHHVQNLLGISDRVRALQQRVGKEEANDLSVRMELQADYFAGVWAHHAQAARNVLERGDLEEALRAAQAIGDDRLQKQAQGYVVPESFTHGTSEQRARWFRRGFESGDMTQGNTFEARSL